MEFIQDPRFLTFIIACIIIIGWEKVSSMRPNTYSKRVLPNFSLLFCASILMKICFPTGLVLLAAKYYEHITVKLPFWFDLIITIIIFDLVIYWQHRIFHIFPLLWKFHSTHHSDNNMDFSTALRFHPVEIILSGVIKLILIVILTPHPMSFLIYEMILSSMALFNHGNINIPQKIDSILRWFIVTPNMHTPHHSPNKEWTNSNYGNFLSLWDRIFRSYNPQYNQEFGLNQKEEIIHSFKYLFFHPFEHQPKD